VSSSRDCLVCLCIMAFVARQEEETIRVVSTSSRGREMVDKED
jgi:hypothetical protein